jgi:hypothetical protein
MDENIYFEALHIPPDLPVGLKYCETFFKRLQHRTLKLNIYIYILFQSADVKISAARQTSSLVRQEVLLSQ